MIKVGDWVMGYANNGSIIKGWVESVSQELVKIYVTESDDKSNIGKRKNTGRVLVKRLETTLELQEGHILNLIDLALDIKDFDECKRLYNMLEVLRGKKQSNLRVLAA